MTILSHFYDFLGDVLAGGNLQTCSQQTKWFGGWFVDAGGIVRSEELDLRGQQNGRQSDEHGFGERDRAMDGFP